MVKLLSFGTRIWSSINVWCLLAIRLLRNWMLDPGLVRLGQKKTYSNCNHGRAIVLGCRGHRRDHSACHTCWILTFCTVWYMWRNAAEHSFGVELLGRHDTMNRSRLPLNTCVLLTCCAACGAHFQEFHLECVRRDSDLTGCTFRLLDKSLSC